MKTRKALKFPIIILWLFIAVLSASCGQDAGSPPALATPEGAFVVDPLFSEFYDMMGGPNMLGPAITPLFSPDHRRFQYVQAGLMQFDPGAASSERYSFAPLALDMNIIEAPVPMPDAEDAVYVNGHIIYRDFLTVYNRLNGARFVGKPLTELIYNERKHAYEQYFENLGFYWIENTPPDQVHLLAYGSWKCNGYCANQPSDAAIVDVPADPPATGVKFQDVVARLGSSFTGFALSDPFVGKDNRVEQIFTNLVMVEDAGLPSGVSFRPLPSLVGVPADPVVGMIGMEGMAFWPLQGDLGHNVPTVFIEYITLHGGIEVSGYPMTELFLYSENTFRQCFDNLCLDYHMQAALPDELRIQPVPLGYAYRDQYYQAPEMGFAESQELKAITLQVWESHSFVNSGQDQVISVKVFEDTTPLHDIEPVLIITLPDGTRQSYYMPPSGLDGKTERSIDPIYAKNGTLIPYQVCIRSVMGEVFCVKDSFVVWYNP